MKMNSTSGQRLRLLSCLFAVLIFLAACGGTTSDSKEEGLGTLRVVSVVPNSLLFIVVQAAERLGTWDGTGLTVKHIQGSSPTAGQIMASGDAEIGLMDGNRAMANIAEGLETRMVASCYSPWAQQIIAGKKSGAKTLEDLKGANFGVSGEGSGGHYATYKVAQSLGWSKADYKITPLGDVKALTAALKSGAIDAFAWSSTTAFNIEEMGLGTVLSPSDKIVGPNVFESFSVMDEVLEKRPEAVRVFFEGYYKTVQELQKNPQLAVDILVEDWNVNPVAAKRAVELELPQLSTDGSISDEQLAGVAEAAEFATGTKVKDPKSAYSYWKDTK